MRKTLLEKCEQIQNEVLPFKNSTLKTKKVFNDLVQFHEEKRDTVASRERMNRSVNVNASAGNMTMTSLNRSNFESRNVSHLKQLNSPF